MLFPIERLLEGRDAPLCVPQTARVREALRLMVENDYSQLPVVDVNGDLVGMVSQELIAHRYFHSGGAVPLLDLAVDHCVGPAVTLTKERDVLEALDRLKDVYALVIVDGHKPVGILTDHDTTHFFRDLTEDLIIVEDIEVTLRQHIESVFPEEANRKKALIAAFGSDRKDEDAPNREFDRLSFWEQAHVIASDSNWPQFNGIFEPKDLFLRFMEQVRMIRNQLVHFRGRPDAVQHDALVQVRTWLEARPGVQGGAGSIASRRDIADGRDLVSELPGKYGPLEAWLVERRIEGRASLRMRFSELEALVREPLPDSAVKHRSWWANDPVSHVQSRSWLGAGWRVEDVDLTSTEVEFRQTNAALMQVFFADLLLRMKASRPGLTTAEKTQAQNWWSFSGGRTGFLFGWVFDSHGKLRVELYIDTGDRQENKRVFDILWGDHSQVEIDVGQELSWERLDAKRASRISAAIPLKITDPVPKLEPAKQWAVETMLKFNDAFRKRIAVVD